jgi:hypothetical protein
MLQRAPVTFLAIIPLAKVITSSLFSSCIALSHYQLLAYATDELSIRVGQTLAGLLNATLVRASSTISWSQSNDCKIIGKCVSQTMFLSIII